MIFGMKKINERLELLREKGYEIKSFLELVRYIKNESENKNAKISRN